MIAAHFPLVAFVNNICPPLSAKCGICRLRLVLLLLVSSVLLASKFRYMTVLQLLLQAFRDKGILESLRVIKGGQSHNVVTTNSKAE